MSRVTVAGLLLSERPRPGLGRGSTVHDRSGGSPADEAPYYAPRVLPGCLGTKGGPRTDAHAALEDA